MTRRCGHCGREATLEYADSLVLLTRQQTLYRAGSDEYELVDVQTIVKGQRCAVCGGATLTQYQWLDGLSDPEDDIDEVALYPPQHEVADLPSRVAKRYSAMLELLHAPDAFAVRAGKTLEAVCADQGLSTGTLNVRLLELAERGDLPSALAEQAHLVREYRNLGGHDDELEPEEADVPLIRGFVESLLEFLYWGPAKLARGSAQLQSRREDLASGDHAAS